MQREDRILRKPEVLGLVGVSDPTVWRWEKAGKFPRRLQLGANSVGWLAGEVNAWLQAKSLEREPHQMPAAAQ